MSSEEEPEMPVVANALREQRGYPDIEVSAIGKSILSRGDKLTTVSDAEEAIRKARQQERQKILDKIEFEEYFEFENRSEEFNHGFRKALENLRDELEEEVE